MLRLRARAQRALAIALVVVPAKVLLSPGYVLRNDQVSLDRVPRRGGGLGQAGKKGDGGSATLILDKSKDVPPLRDMLLHPGNKTYQHS